MSARALLKGVEARLRALLADPNGKLAGVQFDGRPPAFAGQWYYAVHWDGARSDDTNPQSTDHLHDLTVTITAKMAYAPRDRVGERTTLTDEIIDRAEAVVGLVHGQWGVIYAANDLIPGTARYAAIHGGSVATNGFCELLVSKAYGPVREQGPEWVGSDKAANVLTCEVRFGDARRVTVLY